jgi:hypothetical protein
MRVSTRLAFAGVAAFRGLALIAAYTLAQQRISSGFPVNRRRWAAISTAETWVQVWFFYEWLRMADCLECWR